MSGIGNLLTHASSSISDGFTAGSGVRPDTLRVTILAISVGVILAIAAWLIAQIFDAYKDDRATVADAVWGTVKTAVLVSLLLWAVFR